MTDLELSHYLSSIRPADAAAAKQARQRQAQLAKPPGSLGALEDYAERLCAITGEDRPRLHAPAVLVFAADNGVVAEGVAATPQSVTLQQCIHMTEGKTGMSAMARYFGDHVWVTDVGIAAETGCRAIRDRKVRFGTGNIAREAAMTRAEALQAIAAGIEAVQDATDAGCDVIGIGEMGIGNTTTSAAVLAALLQLPAAQVTGRGAGLTDEAFAKKRRVVDAALQLHGPEAENPVQVLQCVGGLDLCAMTGAYLACARLRIPAAVDGLISITAALCAVRLCPAVRDYLFLSHASYEIGYRLAAEALQLQPCLQLGMRLGEGSGCVLLFEILKAACAAFDDMATFEEAAICEDYLQPLRRQDAFTVTGL